MSWLRRLREWPTNCPRLFAALCAVASGLMFSSLWRPPEIPWFLPITVAPMFYLWATSAKFWTRIWSAWLMQFVMGLAGFEWLRETSVLFFGTNWLESLMFLVVFASVSHLGWVLTAFLSSWIFRFEATFPRPLWLKLTTLVVLASWVDCLMPQFFPASLGQPWLWSQTPVFQLAEWVGFKGLSVVTFFFNALIIYPFLVRSHRAWLKTAVVFAGVFAILCALGTWRARVWTPSDASLKTHIVQVFIEPIEILEARFGMDRGNELTLDRFFEFQKWQHSSLPDVILWSETALPVDVSSSSVHLRRFSKFVSENQIPIITGAYRKDSAGKKFNTAAHFNGRGELVATADKRILMPFGEYLPGEEIFPSLRTRFPPDS